MYVQLGRPGFIVYGEGTRFCQFGAMLDGDIYLIGLYVPSSDGCGHLTRLQWKRWVREHGEGILPW